MSRSLNLFTSRVLSIKEIPSKFERGVVKREPVKLQLTANAIDGVKAGLGSSYLQGIATLYFG